MSEPRRPPPPKSYVPLDLSTRPPKLPPRPAVADAGPPPNYTPPPPPLSDEEEEEEEEERGEKEVAPTSKPRPPPPAPYQPKAQPQPPTPKQILPTPHQHPPPNRPARPPSTNKPSPHSPSHRPSPSSAPPRAPHPRSKTLSHPQSPSGAKGGAMVSAQPMAEDTIPSPHPQAPSRPQPPSHPPPSPTSSSTQSPRVPVRKAPSRPPPARKAPPTTNHSPLPPPVTREDGTDNAPVAPPRRKHVGGGAAEQGRKPPLYKSTTLPPHSRDTPSPRHGGESDTAQRQVPPKPTPYRDNGPPSPNPSVPPMKISAGGNDSTKENFGSRTLPGRPKPPPPRARERTTPETTEAKPPPPRARERTTPETTEAKPPPPRARERTTPETTEAKPPPPRAREKTTPETTEAKPPPPRAREKTTPETTEAKPPPPRAREKTTPETTEAKPPPPRAREKTRPETTEANNTAVEIEDMAHVRMKPETSEASEQPQAEERTPFEVPETTTQAVQPQAKKRSTALVESVGVMGDSGEQAKHQTPSPKPRRSVSIVMGSNARPQPRPRAASSSRLKAPPSQHHPSQPPSSQPPQPLPPPSSEPQPHLSQPPPPQPPSSHHSLQPQPPPSHPSPPDTRQSEETPPSTRPTTNSAPDRGGSSVDRPSRARPPPPSRPPMKGPPSPSRPPMKGPPSPSRPPTKAGSTVTPSHKPSPVPADPPPEGEQLVVKAEIDSNKVKQEDGAVHVPTSSESATSAPNVGNKDEQEHVNEPSRETGASEQVKQTVGVPDKPPPPVRRSSLIEKKTTQREVEQPHTSSGSAPEPDKRPQPGRPPPPVRRSSLAQRETTPKAEDSSSTIHEEPEKQKPSPPRQEGEKQEQREPAKPSSPSQEGEKQAQREPAKPSPPSQEGEKQAQREPAKPSPPRQEGEKQAQREPPKPSPPSQEGEKQEQREPAKPSPPRQEGEKQEQREPPKPSPPSQEGEKQEQREPAKPSPPSQEGEKQAQREPAKPSPPSQEGEKQAQREPPKPSPPRQEGEKQEQREPPKPSPPSQEGEKQAQREPPKPSPPRQEGEKQEQREPAKPSPPRQEGEKQEQREPPKPSPSRQEGEKQEQREPAKPSPPRQVSQTVQGAEHTPSTEAAAPRKKPAKPGKPPPPRQQSVAVKAAERVVRPTVAKRRNTVSGKPQEEGSQSRRLPKAAPVSEKEVKGEGSDVPQAEKQPKRSKPRPLMVIRPGHNGEQKVSVSKVAPKQTRPPGRPTAQPNKKQAKTERIAVTESAVEAPEGSTALLPSAREEILPGAEETKLDREARTETTTVAEKTEQESTGVVLRRRAADDSVIQLDTYPKRSRPMSMSPGRPAKPRKPPAPSTKPLGQDKPPKPSPGPARPAHGPARPALGPSRPPPSSKSQTTTAASPLDPNKPPALPPRPTPGHLLYKYVCKEPHGLALTNHEPLDPAELPYEEGDVIELIERLDKYWFYARNADLEMTEGAVPARDLRIVKRLPGESTVSGFEEGPCAVATYTFQGQTMDELSFKEGDLIMLKARVGKEWLRGKLVSGEGGIFPRSYVEIVEDLPADAVEEVPAPTQSQSTVEIHGPHCVALYDFSGASADELGLSVGDTVVLVGRVGTEWLRGRLGGKEGIFPSQFVEVKQDLPAEGEGDGLSKTLYDFEGQKGELSFKAGARVKVVCRVDEEWVEGELDGKTGMFPASFVDHLPPDLPMKRDTTEPTQTKPVGKCEASYDFTAENAGELSFKTGDVIVTLEWVNEEWMNGRLGEREGMFPVAFVKVLTELPKPQKKDTSKGLSHVTRLDDNLLPRAKALKDFTATNSQHLSFKTGDILNLLERIGRGDWYSGENTRTGSFGDFPASVVTVIEPLP